MRAIRKIVDNNKGLVTFLLVLFFLTTGLAKGFAGKAPSLHKNDKNAVKPELSNVTEADDNLLSFLGQFTDGDIDDAAITITDNYAVNKIFACEAATQKFAECNSYKNYYSVALYDLYCNWRHHLS
jgi:hypothetical protein